MKLADIVIHESLFLRHLSTRWLTLCPALEKIVARWSDTKSSFLSYISLKQKQQTKSERYKQIVRCLKEKEKVSNQVFYDMLSFILFYCSYEALNVMKQ